MEVISRKISLEPYTTRYPVCYPSLDGGVVIYLQPNGNDAVYVANYGRMPLGIDEESIDKHYSDFTQEMHDAYHDKVLSYQVLQRWFTEMIEYRRMLYNNPCHGKFSSMVDYYGGNFNNAQYFDNIYILHGGDNFYEWLIDNYFALLDLEDIYYKNVEISDKYKTYQEWFDVITKVGTSKITYPYALQLLAKLTEWHELYSEDEGRCADEEFCCDCVDYWLMGGNVMYNLLSWWVNKINTNITQNNNQVSGLTEDSRFKLYPEIDISLLLKEKEEDFGYFSVFSNNFNKYQTYSDGDVCIFNSDVWIKDENKTIDGAPDDGWNIDGAPGPGWTKYSIYYYSQPEYSGETISQHTIPNMSGRTSSSLSSFERKEETVDGLGNSLPGYFRPSSGSTVTHPAENSLLELKYKPGTFFNSSTIINGGVVTDKTFFGDVIASISFMCKDVSGNIMSAFTSTSDDVMDKLSACKSFADEKNTYNQQVNYTPTDGKIYADFTYYKGCVFNITTGGSVSVSGETYLKCVDHCVVEESTCQYHLSQTESYPLRYYKVIMEEETQYSEEQQKNIPVCLCDFFFKPSVFTEQINVVSPIFRKDELLNFSRIEKTVDNIYIDRGYVTVLDKHLRIGEIRNFEQLEKYGNGMFQIFNTDEGII